MHDRILVAAAAAVGLLELAGLAYVATQERRTRNQAHALRLHLDKVAAKATALEARMDLQTTDRMLADAVGQLAQPRRRHLASVTTLPCPPDVR